MPSRRDFLRSAAALGAASMLPRAGGAEPNDSAAKIDKVGLQLYTVRRALAADFEGTIAKVAAIGYREVEFASYANRTPAQVRDVLTRNRLTSPAAHVGTDVLGAKWGATLEAAKAVGHEYVIIAWLPVEQRRGLDDYKRTAETFNRAAREAQAAGLKFGYHNHDFEFAPAGGTIPYDVLLAETDPALVWFEMDLYWITKTGNDPLAYFARFPGRFPLVHVKDSAGPPAHQMTAVGRGTIDFKRIFARRQQAGIQHYFVEHDNPEDAIASITTSYKYLEQLRF